MDVGPRGWRKVEVVVGGEARDGEGSRLFFLLPPRWLRRFLGSRSFIIVPSTSIRAPLPMSSMPLAIISEDALELESLPSSPRSGSEDMTQRISEFCLRFSSLQARWLSRRDLPLYRSLTQRGSRVPVASAATLRRSPTESLPSAIS